MSDRDFSTINNWFRAEFEEQFVNSSAGGPFRYAVSRGNPNRGTIIIVPGRTEFIEKYLELCWDLRALGYSLCIYDHFGQGKSGRQLKDRNKGHISDFNIYVSDLIKIIETVVLPMQSGPVYLLAHSMGCTVSMLAAYARPELISGSMLISPMFQINTGKFLPPILTELMCNIVCFAGGSSLYIWGGGPFDPCVMFNDNPLTTDPGRFSHNCQLIKEDKNLELGSPTFEWMKQAYRAMRQVRRQTSEISCPTIIFRAIEERVVGLKEMERFCREVKTCRMVTFKDCQHELLMEKDEIRSELINSMNRFLE